MVSHFVNSGTVDIHGVSLFTMLHGFHYSYLDEPHGDITSSFKHQTRTYSGSAPKVISPRFGGAVRATYISIAIIA